MKFLCLKCDSQMNYESQEQVDTLRLGITFACTSCDTKIAMVTNAGETQLVNFLSQELKIPILGVIENMTGSLCPHCGEGIELFEPPSKEKSLVEALGLPLLGRIPFDRRIASSTDRGLSFTDLHGNTPAGQAFSTLSKTLMDGLISQKRSSK